MAGKRARARRPYVLKHEVEILLPLYYNDGTPVEFAKFQQTLFELTEKFGGCRATPTDEVAYEGLWKYRGVVYRDLIKTVLIEAPCRSSNYEWLARYKRRLEDRFQQIEIYVKVSAIRRIL